MRESTAQLEEEMAKGDALSKRRLVGLLLRLLKAADPGTQDQLWEAVLHVILIQADLALSNISSTLEWGFDVDTEDFDKETLRLVQGALRNILNLVCGATGEELLPSWEIE